MNLQTSSVARSTISKLTHRLLIGAAVATLLPLIVEAPARAGTQVGNGSATGGASIAISDPAGSAAIATKTDTIAVGNEAEATGAEAISVGGGSAATGTLSHAIGSDVGAVAASSTAVGANSGSTGIEGSA